MDTGEQVKLCQFLPGYKGTFNINAMLHCKTSATLYNFHLIFHLTVPVLFQYHNNSRSDPSSTRQKNKALCTDLLSEVILAYTPREEKILRLRRRIRSNNADQVLPERKMRQQGKMLSDRSVKVTTRILNKLNINQSDGSHCKLRGANYATQTCHP